MKSIICGKLVAVDLDKQLIRVREDDGNAVEVSFASWSKVDTRLSGKQIMKQVKLSLDIPNMIRAYLNRQVAVFLGAERDFVAILSRELLPVTAVKQ